MEKRLYRSRRERMISGVCGGIADYFAVDPTLVRVIWVLVTLTSGGLGFLAYIAAIIIVPEEPRALRPADAAASAAGGPASTAGGIAGGPVGDAAETAANPAGEAGSPMVGEAGQSAGEASATTETHTTWTHSEADRHSGRMIAGLVLVVVGGYFLLHNLLPRFFFLEGRFVWPALLVVAGVLVLARGLQRRG